MKPIKRIKTGIPLSHSLILVCLCTTGTAFADRCACHKEASALGKASAANEIERGKKKKCDGQKDISHGNKEVKEGEALEADGLKKLESSKENTADAQNLE